MDSPGTADRRGETGSGGVGTGVGHPDFGTLVRDEDADLVVCHVCGRGFRALGSHLRSHGLSADEYRARYGLRRLRSLSSHAVAGRRSVRQAAAFRTSPELREQLAAGHAMARSGELRRAVAGGRNGPQPEELVRARSANLATGRSTQVARRGQRLRAALHQLGFTDLGEALRTLYVREEGSVERVAARLQVGRTALRHLLEEHGIPLRPTGVNSAAGRRSRTAINDERTARLVGAPDIGPWLLRRRAAGATLRDLALETRRSIPWITARLGSCAVETVVPAQDAGSRSEVLPPGAGPHVQAVGELIE
ncbi:MucR family transcriptional regulator [Kitasatospora fiedleri]|uniref:MucR family transcriptional regulator n=1 Tax=Kitasatospora fiedleri TaxID=2991545 RepID=UPI00249B7417|nr:MucR family transcriptional regulator [Kitasatospora fiedleri]